MTAKGAIRVVSLILAHNLIDVYKCHNYVVFQDLRDLFYVDQFGFQFRTVGVRMDSSWFIFYKMLNTLP